MKKTLRPSVISLAVLVALAGVTYAYPNWPESLGLDFWSLPRWQNELEIEARRSAELGERDSLILRRLYMKQAAVTELIAGKIDLREAAAQFLAVNSPEPEAMHLMRTQYRGANDEQSAGKQVIAFLSATLGSDSQVTDERIAALEAELASWVK